MGIIYLMIAVSLAMAIVFLVSFIWATRNGQFDDDYSPAVRILFEEEVKSQKDKNNRGEDYAHYPAILNT
jgi:cbb3-type cytochrome oxidase maturation protein